MRKDATKSLKVTTVPADAKWHIDSDYDGNVVKVEKV